MVAIGGGALLDMVGFVAATTHRGVRHIRVPTTVLAQNDSGVGVKNGVNAFGVKNLLGAFAPPFAVLNDAKFLRTLQPRDKIAGIAEAVKVALIRDGVFFEWLEAQRRCAARLRARGDGAHDPALRRAAHAPDRARRRPVRNRQRAAARLRALVGAQARGADRRTNCATARRSRSAWRSTRRYSVQIGMLAAGRGRARLHSCSSASVSTCGIRRWRRAMRRDADHVAGIEEFREHLGGELTITLLREIGGGEEVHAMDDRRDPARYGWLRSAGPAQ